MVGEGNTSGMDVKEKDNMNICIRTQKRQQKNTFFHSSRSKNIAQEVIGTKVPESKSSETKVTVNQN